MAFLGTKWAVGNGIGIKHTSGSSILSSGVLRSGRGLNSGLCIMGRLHP